MPSHVANREELIEALRLELVGPDPRGEPVHLVDGLELENVKDLFVPWVQESTGEEILTRDRPTKRYGVAVLFPAGTRAEDGGEGTEGNSDEDLQHVDDPDEGGDPSEVLTRKAHEGIEAAKGRRGRDDSESELDFDIKGVNEFKPSAMAVTFLAGSGSSSLNVRVTGAAYRIFGVSSGARKWKWWARDPIAQTFSVSLGGIQQDGMVEIPPSEPADSSPLALKLRVVSRQAEEGFLITACLVNRTEGTGVDGRCLFQSRLEVECRHLDGSSSILPYPERLGDTDEEESSLAMLFRSRRTFAIGHGCSADWSDSDSGTSPDKIIGDPLPVVSVPSMTPEIRRGDRSPVEVSMESLARLDVDEEGFGALEEVVDLYRQWIELRELELQGFDPPHREVAHRHMRHCVHAADRMEDGLRFLAGDMQARTAFALANKAMLIQQQRVRRDSRQAQYDSQSGTYFFPDPAGDPADPVIEAGQGVWRPFQVAFQLMTLRSVAEGGDPDRELVELIWFPTGGGKTEAYLGLAAFSMLLRRLRRKEDCGTDVLMRYTLRLLTAQQFQRAARLICALDWIRQTSDRDLGPRFSIGLWLGRSTTPNWNADGKAELRKLTGSTRGRGQDWLVVRACPWCAAEMGVIRRRSRKDWPNEAPQVLGYEEWDEVTLIRCPDSSCLFHEELPLVLIDEQIYRDPPTLIIGTVDKFASLAWRDAVRSIFGINKDGERVHSPPTLIIQDELHLISGPLGSMVGLYETVVHELCTDDMKDPPVPPKIVCATATIRGFESQVRALFARTRSAVFPPPGIDIADSFFSSEARDEDNRLMPGKKFVGIHAPGLGSVPTTQVRTFSAMLQAPVPLPKADRDPWWTLVVFYNSLRELGTGLSVLQTDIPEHLRSIANRWGMPFSERRKLFEVHELTGRLRDEEIPMAIELLERSTESHRYPVDVCLASNIIEVGVDIDRLSLMSVVGQPKTTSQYIQVTGRVGRRWWERPGLVLTIFNPAKPRDRSHFEHFRSYHERLYAQVERISVTPFSRPALLRALHAVIVAFVRQRAPTEDIESPYPVPTTLLANIKRVLVSRGSVAAEEDLPTLEEVFDRRVAEWEVGGRSRWESPIDSAEIPLMYGAGFYVPDAWRNFSWPTPWSMRSVDAECQAVISQLYNQPDEN